MSLEKRCREQNYQWNAQKDGRQSMQLSHQNIFQRCGRQLMRKVAVVVAATQFAGKRGFDGDMKVWRHP